MNNKSLNKCTKIIYVMKYNNKSIDFFKSQVLEFDCLITHQKDMLKVVIGYQDLIITEA